MLWFLPGPYLKFSLTIFLVYGDIRDVGADVEAAVLLMF